MVLACVECLPLSLARPPSRSPVSPFDARLSSVLANLGPVRGILAILDAGVFLLQDVGLAYVHLLPPIFPVSFHALPIASSVQTYRLRLDEGLDLTAVVRRQIQ